MEGQMTYQSQLDFRNNLIKSFNGPINYAEIGILQGNGISSALKVLPKGSSLYLYDFEPVIRENQNRFRSYESDYDFHWISSPTKSINTDPLTCIRNAEPRKSYVWHLLKKALDEPDFYFHYIVLDGAHEVTIDGAALFVLDTMMREGTYLDTDDYNWSPSRSPSMGQQQDIKSLFYEEEWNSNPIGLLFDLIKKTNRYEEVKKDQIWKRVNS